MNHDQDPFGFQGKGKEPARSHRNGKGKEPAPFDSDSASTSTTPASASMGYMSIGNGPGSEHTARLQQMLEEDSGYGGSIASNDSWDIHNQGTSGGVNSFNSSSNGHGHSQAGAIHQIWYNRHRSALARAINNVVDLLRGLQETNSQWPAYYPLVQGSQEPAPLRRTFTSGASSSPSPLNRLRRSATSTDPHPNRSSPAPEDDPNSSSAESCPRLVSPQIAQEFSVLKLDLKLSGSSSMNQTELVHSLEKTSIASLLDSKISSSIKHLYALRDRIEDTSSKVLITGDLNAGKSTFCNALLRRKILPEDQQPCTSMFCEVLDARENANIEEVHAIHHDTVYNRNDETTYDVYQLSDLEELVVDNTHYLQCKVFVKDVRTIDESLLNNGVVDIALIDAPGLNSDTTKTTAVFARQEEIDVVVFVVSAANHFTMTAQEFITTAAAEKAYMFMVVNGFDVIRDKKRCEQTILKQVNNLSPDTYNESKELVHFVSSNAIPMTPPGGPGGGPGGDGGGDEGPSDPNKNKVADNLRDFQNLEQSLRRFVLEKRAKSKLAPARKYLLNTLNDLSSLANANHEVASAELQRVKKDLLELEPQVEASRRATTEVSDAVDTKIEETCRNVYETTRATLNEAIASSGETTHGVEYPGIFGVFSFAEELKAAMLEHVSDAVHDCEDYAKQRTVEGVEAIKKLGMEHLGDEYKALNFRPDVMFSRRRDMAARQVEVTTEVWDFVDISTLMQNQEKFAGTGMALTVATAVGSRALGINSWMDSAVTAVRLLGIDNMKKLAVPAAVVAAVGLAAYVFRQIPKSLPRRLADKISTQLASDDYVHGNSMRIGQSVRKVLRFPADNLRVSLEQSAKALGVKRDDTIKTKKENEVASKYFGNLMRATAQTRSLVQGIDLDSPPPGSQVH
ncbi:Transmembrane GTPase fzo1 [Ceratocystis platani]|uniref:Transmembrane GTPase fzo1 n=1 Tax=Ceratocystis fimbriata f. sp. platani TaxID=88771 RepID=A0A0F8AXK9_CERFI|nr:Transmembrane GTPase fzo1 [Ceratocystis platani]